MKGLNKKWISLNKCINRRVQTCHNTITSLYPPDHAFTERNILSFMLIEFTVKRDQVFPHTIFIYNVSPHIIIHIDQVYEIIFFLKFF
jgi:hypothetical protein